MKRLVIVAVTALALMGTSECYAQAKNLKERLKSRKELMKASKDLNDEKASKRARNEAKQMTKDGWRVAPGALPLEAQLDNSYLYQQLKEENDVTDNYVWGDAISTGESYDAAKMQALELARVNLIGNIENNITKLVKNNQGNKQLKANDAASVISTLQESKSFVTQKLGQTSPTIDVYRELSNGNIQVRIMTFYSMDTAREIAKQVIREQMEKNGTTIEGDLDEYLE